MAQILTFLAPTIHGLEAIMYDESLPIKNRLEAFAHIDVLLGLTPEEIAEWPISEEAMRDYIEMTQYLQA